MKKGAYFVYLAACLICWTVILLFVGVSFELYIDIASLLLIMTFLGCLTFFQTGFKKAVSYYKTVFNTNADSSVISEAATYFSTLSFYTLGTGGIGFLTGLIAMMANLEDTASVGPNMAVALITMLYALMFCILVFLPFKLSLERRVREKERG